MVEIYKKYKSELGIFVVLPTLIGSLVQLIKLIRISPSYYVFFSLSQCVIDGAIIMLKLVSIYILYFYCTKFLIEDEFHLVKNKIYLKGNTRKKRRILFLRLLLLHFSFLVGSLTWINFISDFSWPKKNDYYWIVGLSVILSLITPIIRTRIILVSLLELCKKRLELEYRDQDYVRFETAVYLAIGFIATASFNTKLPELGHNESNFISHLKEEFQLEDVKITYFNDSYIIVKLQKENCEWQNGVFKSDLYFSPLKLTQK